jgi:hypothetical protein
LVIFGFKVRMGHKMTNTQMLKRWAEYFFFHLHLSVVDHWEKLECIERTLQPTNFQVFITIFKKYIDKKSK